MRSIGSPSNLQRPGAGFEELVRSNYAPVHSFVLRRVASAAVADDLVAEVFVVAWKRYDAIESGKERAWLYGVARNKVRHHWRSEQSKDRLLRDLSERSIQLVGSDPSVIIADVERTAAVLQQLNADELELLQLVSWEGLGPTSLGVVLECSPNAASIRVHRLRAHIQTLMDDFESADVQGDERCIESVASTKRTTTSSQEDNS